MNILKRPMFYAAVGCCMAATFSLFQKTYAVLFLLSAIIFLTVFSIVKKHNMLIVILTLTLFLANLFFQFIKIEKINICDGKTIDGYFLVTSDIIEYDNFNTITLKPVNCDSIDKSVKILVFDYKKTKLKMGDIVDARLRISSIDKNDEYRISNYGNGIYATANIKKIKNVGYNNLYIIAGNIRTYVNDTVSKRFNGDTAGLLCAITTGDKTLISEDLSHNVKTTGISHVVVVSGMHLSIIMAAVFFVIDKLFYNKYLRCFLAFVIIIVITAVCGFTMSVIRAGATFIIASFAPIFNRDNDPLNSLLTAVTFILICDPFAIFNISFLLSLLSTLAIIWVVPFYSNLLFTVFKIKSKIIHTIIQIILCCLFANIFTLPVSIKMFGYMSIVSPLTNLCITYFVTLALIFNIVAIALYAIPFVSIIGQFFITLAGLCSQFIVFIVNQIASLPITVAVLPKSAFWVSIFIVVLVVTFMYFCSAKLKKKEVMKCQ